MLVEVVSLTVLVLALVAQLVGFKSLFKYLFFVSIFLATAYYVYLTYGQYMAWREADSLTKFLVPPYNNVTYILGYHFVRFALHYIISLGLALLFLILANYFNKKFENRFFEKEEPYLGALSIFVLSHPFWLYYFLALIIGYLIIHLYFFIKHHIDQRKIREEKSALAPRVPMYWLWLPIGILAQLVKYWL